MVLLTQQPKRTKISPPSLLSQISRQDLPRSSSTFHFNSLACISSDVCLSFLLLQSNTQKKATEQKTNYLQTMRFSRFLPLALTASTCAAFAPPQTSVQLRNKMQMMPTADDMNNLHHLSTLAPMHEQLVSQVSTWISDAAAAVPDDAKEDIGLWESYIQLYKNGLAFVHDNIVDEPLRKMGFTQTWGPSIFLFTAGEFYVCNSDNRFCQPNDSNAIYALTFRINHRCAFTPRPILNPTKQIIRIHEGPKTIHTEN